MDVDAGAAAGTGGLAGLLKFWGLDPKRIELAIGRGWWDHYADKDEDMVLLLGKKSMQVKRKAMPSNVA
jgi:hypothetical protein